MSPNPSSELRSRLCSSAPEENNNDVSCFSNHPTEGPTDKPKVKVISSTQQVRKEVRDGTPRTLNFEDMPEWFRHNPHLRTGYRPIFPCCRMCLQSVWKYRSHNEFMNIMTHLFAALITLGCLIHWGREVTYFSEVKLHLEEKIVMVLFLVGTICCFSFSTVYHIFNCHSEQVMWSTVKWDYIGIMLMIWGSSYPWIYYAYACQPVRKYMYFGLAAVSGYTVTSMAAKDTFDKFKGLRIATFGLLIASELIPVGDYILSRGLKHTWDTMALDYLLYVLISHGVASIFYASHVPERIWPRTFDIICPSHTIFHVLVAIGAYFHFAGLSQITELRDLHLNCSAVN